MERSIRGGGNEVKASEKAQVWCCTCCPTLLCTAHCSALFQQPLFPCFALYSLHTCSPASLSWHRWCCTEDYLTQSTAPSPTWSRALSPPKHLLSFPFQKPAHDQDSCSFSLRKREEGTPQFKLFHSYGTCNISSPSSTSAPTPLALKMMSQGKDSLASPTCTSRAAFCTACFQHVKAKLQHLKLQKAHDVRNYLSTITTGDPALRLSCLKKDLDWHIFLTSQRCILPSISCSLSLLEAEIICLGFFPFFCLPGSICLVFSL